MAIAFVTFILLTYHPAQTQASVKTTPTPIPSVTPEVTAVPVPNTYHIGDVIWQGQNVNLRFEGQDSNYNLHFSQTVFEMAGAGVEVSNPIILPGYSGPHDYHFMSVILTIQILDFDTITVTVK